MSGKRNHTTIHACQTRAVVTLGTGLYLHAAIRTVGGSGYGHTWPDPSDGALSGHLFDRLEDRLEVR